MKANFNAFLKANKREKPTLKLAVSEAFLGEDEKPVEWEIKALSMAEFNEAVDKATAPNGMRDRDQMNNDIIAAAVVFPDLTDGDLQDSYGVVDEAGLVREMFRGYAGDYVKLLNAIMDYSGLNESLTDKVAEAKN